MGYTITSPTSNANTQGSREGDSRAHGPRGLTWGGGLVDDVVSILFGNNSVAHSQKGEELLYALSCGLQTEEQVNPSATPPLTHIRVRFKSSAA